MKTLKFVFVRACHSGPRYKLEQGRITEEEREDQEWEVRCIPGNLIGHGATFTQAYDQCVDLIRLTLSEKPDWYKERKGHLSQIDQMYFRDLNQVMVMIDDE